jgi:exodeoxyribonuclease V alpha subunit
VLSVMRHTEDHAVYRDAAIKTLTAMGFTYTASVKLCDAYGPDVIRVVISDPYRIAIDISGIGFKTVDAISAALASGKLASVVATALGADEADCIFAQAPPKNHSAEYPYASGGITAPAFSSHTSERNAAALSPDNASAVPRATPEGCAAHSPAPGGVETVPRATPEGCAAHRTAAGILYILTRYASEGHTCVPRGRLIQRTIELLNTSSDDIEDSLIELIMDGRANEATIDGSPSVFLNRYFMAERRVCTGLMRLMASEPGHFYSDPDDLIGKTEAWLGISLSGEQRAAVRDSIQSGVFVVTGGPGTGKTTIIRAVIDIFEHAGMRTAVAAPTGRAAKRVTEATGHRATTIHRLLEYYYDEEDREMHFGRNSKNKLDRDAVIIDEASMVDVILMEALLAATNTGTRLIIVGDADQLPPVGAGDVLRDILESGRIPSAVLTEIYRQAAESMIVVNAHRIDRGEYPEAGGEGSDFIMMERSARGDALSDVLRLCAGDLPCCAVGAPPSVPPPTHAADLTSHIPVSGIQALSPMKKGLLGCVNLNRELQATLNPPSPGKAERKYGDRVFREGDRVMHTRNNYSIEWTDSADGSEGRGVFNGDMGIIKGIDEATGAVTVAYDDTKYVTYATNGLMEIEHAYAITVHKSQGSEFPVVIIPVYAAAPMLMTRNLIYTAITRGKQLVVLVGSMELLRQMIDNAKGLARYSGLKSFLMEYSEIIEMHSDNHRTARQERADEF